MCFQAEAELYFSKNSDCYLHFGRRLLKVHYPSSIPWRGLMGFLIYGNFSQELSIHFGELYMFSVSPQFHSCTHALSSKLQIPFLTCEYSLFHSVVFCDIFTKISTDHNTFVKAVSCAISQQFFHCGTSCFSVYYKTPQLTASDTRHLKVFDFCHWNELHTLKRGKFICWKLFFSQLWKSCCYLSTFQGNFLSCHMLYVGILGVHRRLRLAWRVSSYEFTWTEKFKVNQTYKLAQNRRRDHRVSTISCSLHLLLSYL